MRHTGSVRGRFGGFAAGHFTLSILGFGGWLLLSGAWGLPVFPVYVYVLMLLYVPAGWVVSSLRRWPAPDLKTGVKAVLYPALCAWIWAFGGLWLFSSGGTLPSVGYLGLQILLSTFLLASPSALFVLMTGLAFLDGAAPWLWLPQVILAGLLPPLLFFLGSLLPRISREGYYDESEKGSDTPGSPGRAPRLGPAPDGGPGQGPAGGDCAVRDCQPGGTGGDCGGLPARRPDGGAVQKCRD